MSPHGGPRPGAGRNPGQGPFRGGRPVSTKKLRTGQRLSVSWVSADGERTLMETVEVRVVSRTKIELITEEGDKYVILG